MSAQPTLPKRGDDTSCSYDEVIAQDVGGQLCWADGKPMSCEEVFAVAQVCIYTLKVYEEHPGMEAGLLNAWQERRNAFNVRQALRHAEEQLQRHGPHPNEQPSLRLRQLVLARQNGVCVDCGVSNSKNNRALELHRVVPGRLGGRYTKENVVALCHSCHRKRVPR